MEPAVVQLDGIANAFFVLVDDQFIVQSKLAFRCPCKVGSHLDVAINVSSKNMA